MTNTQQTKVHPGIAILAISQGVSLTHFTSEMVSDLTAMGMLKADGTISKLGVQAATEAGTFERNQKAVSLLIATIAAISMIKKF